MPVKGLTAILGVMATFTGGCAVQPHPGDQQIPVPEMEETEQAVERVADQIHQDLIKLRATLDGPVAPKPTPTPKAYGELAQPLTLKWAGPALPALHTVADMIGYELDTKGFSSKPLPVIYINVTDEPALSVLEDIGWQVGPDMGVVVSESERIIYVFSGGRK